MTREQKLRLTIACIVAAVLHGREAPPTVEEVVQIANAISGESLSRAKKFVTLYEAAGRPAA